MPDTIEAMSITIKHNLAILNIALAASLPVIAAVSLAGNSKAGPATIGLIMLKGIAMTNSIPLVVPAACRHGAMAGRVVGRSAAMRDMSNGIQVRAQR